MIELDNVSLEVEIYLGLCDDHIDTVRPRLYQLETLVGQGEPAVSLALNVSPQCDPVLSAVPAITTSAQQTPNVVPCKCQLQLARFRN